MENIGGKMYSPTYVTCNWVAGAAYILLAIASLRFGGTGR